jgi:hypothetical protein
MPTVGAIGSWPPGNRRWVNSVPLHERWPLARVELNIHRRSAALRLELCNVSSRSYEKWTKWGGVGRSVPFVGLGLKCPIREDSALS